MLILPIDWEDPKDQQDYDKLCLIVEKYIVQLDDFVKVQHLDLAGFSIDQDNPAGSLLDLVQRIQKYAAGRLHVATEYEDYRKRLRELFFEELQEYGPVSSEVYNTIVTQMVYYGRGVISTLITKKNAT